MPKIKYKELAAALRQDFGNDVANLDDLTLAQNWVNDNPDKADLIEFNVESPPTKRTGNLMEDLKSAPPLPRTRVAFQRERGGVEVPFIPQQFGFQGGEMVQPARPEIDESSLESPFVQVDSEPVLSRGVEILPTKFSNTIEGRNILDFTAGKKDLKSIEDYYKNIAKEGAVGSESDFGKGNILANSLFASEAFAADDYNENYPDAPLSFDDIKASLSNPEFANERNAAIDEINSTISKANWYGAMDLQDEYNQYAELANQLQADFDAKFGDFERSYAGYEQSVKKYGIPEAQGRLAEINERVLQQAKELDETNFFGKAILAASRLVGGGGYLLSDFAGALGATDIADKMKSYLTDNLLATKDPRLALFKAPYDPKTGQFVEGGLLSANTLGFVFEQGLNMIPSIVAAATPYGRLGQLAVGAIGTAALTYDEYSAEIDQAALQAGAKIDPQTRAILSAVGAAKTGLIENAIPINRFFKNGMSKAFSENAVKALASGKSLDFAIKAGTQGIKAFGLTSGVEVAEELLDQGVQESINASITNQFPELKGQPQFEEKSLEDYAGIAVNTLVAVAPLGGVGFAYSGSRLKEDLFHNVARNNKVEVTLDLFEQNKDKFKDSQYKKNVDRLSLIGNIYGQIPEDIDDVSARKIADKMLEIESINSKMDKNTPQAIRDRNTAKIDKINQEISAIFSEAEMSRPTVTEAPEEAFPTIELQIPESDQNVLNAVSERIEPIIAPLVQRMTNAEEIDMAEIEAVAEQMIDEQSRILESENLSEAERQNLSDLIESQIDNLLNYEFATTTTTEQAGEARQVKGVIRTAKPGLPQKISTDRFIGVQATNPETGEQGRLVVTRVPITQSRTGLKYQFVPNSSLKKIEGGEYKATQGILSVDEGAFPSTPLTNMQWVSSNFDQNSNLSSVVVRDAVSGNELRIDDQDLALDIAIAESQRQIGTVPEGAILSTAQKVVPMERLVKVFPNIRETGTAPEAAGVQPQTEQYVRQETNVSQERGDKGEITSSLPQEEGRKEGEVTPAVEGGTQVPPAAKAGVEENPDVGRAINKLKESLKALKAKPDGGANIDLTFGVVPITKAVWNTAIDTAILAIDAGQTVAQAVKAASDYISSQIQGDWGKGKFESYMKDQFAPSGEFLTIFNASPKELGDLGKRSGVAYFATDEKEAKIYADMNRGKVREFKIKKSDVSTQDVVLDKIKELGLKPKDSKYTIDEALLYELIDDRFDNSLSQSDINRLFNELKKDGVKAFSYDDGGLGAKETTQSVAIIDQNTIVESAVEKAQEKPTTQPDVLKDVESTAKALDKKINVRKSSIAVRLRKLAGLIAHGGEDVISKFDSSKIKGGLRGRYGKGIYFSSLFKNYDYGDKTTYLDIRELNLMNGNMSVYEALNTLSLPSEIKRNINVLRNFLNKAKNNKDYNEILSEIKKLESTYSKFDENSNYIERTLRKEADKNPSERLDSILESREARAIEANNLDASRAIKGLDDSLNNILIESGFDGIIFDEGREILIIPQEKNNDYIVQSQEKFISESYHKAKKDGSNPELVKVVEDMLGAKAEPTTEKTGTKAGRAEYGKMKDSFFGGMEPNKNRLFFADATNDFQYRGDSRADIVLMLDGANFWLTEGSDGYVTIEDFQVSEDKLGTGKGKFALSKLIEYADRNGITLIGEPLAQAERGRGRTQKGLSQKQLIEFYKKNGFEKISKDTLSKNKTAENAYLERKPKDLLVGEQQQEKAEKPKTSELAKKAAKSFSNWVRGGESRGLGIANLPEQDAERFKKFTEDVGELISALINNGVTRASTALKMIKPYFAENESQFSRYERKFFKEQFNLSIIDKYPDLHKRAKGLEKKLERALTQKEKLLAKDVEEARNNIIEKIKLRLNPSSWSKSKSGILAKARLTNESISELKLYSEIFNDESLSQMDGKELKALYNEINSMFKSGARSQSASNKILSNYNKSLKEKSLVYLANSLGASESVKSLESAKAKSKRAGVTFYVIDNKSGEITQISGNKISEWESFLGKEFFESGLYSVIAIDTNRNTLFKNDLLKLFKRPLNTIKLNHLYDIRNMTAMFSGNEDSYNFFKKNFIDLVWKADYNRDELKQEVGRFDKIVERLKKDGININVKKRVKSIVLRIGDAYAEGTSEKGLDIGQIINVFMMLRDPQALVRSGGEGLVNYNKEDIDNIIQYVLNDEGLLRAVNEVTQVYQDFLNEQIIPVLTNYGYSVTSFEPKEYDKNSSFSKNAEENARAIEILNKVYSNKVPQSVPYSPLSIFGEKEVFPDVLESSNKEDVMSVMSNNVIPRKDGGQIIFSNVAFKYNNYMDGMIDMITRMPLLNNAKAMFGKDQMTLIRNRYGNSAADAIKSNIQRVVTDKSPKIKTAFMGSSVSDWVNRSVLGQMWFNTRAALFQPIAILNFAPLAPSIGDYFASIKSMNFVSNVKEIQGIGWVKERFGGKILSIDAKELEKRNEDGQINPFAALDKLLKIGYTPTQAFDFLSIIIGGGPLYDSVKNKKYKEYIKTMDENAAKTAAQNDASLALYEATNESQQSANNMLISNAQRNPLLRLLMSFTTANQQLTRKAILSAQLLSKGIGDPARHAYIMLQFGLINTAIFTIISRTPELVYEALDFGDEDEDKDLKKSKREKELESKYFTELLSGLFSGFGVPGSLFFTAGIKPFISDSFNQEKYDELSLSEKFDASVEKLSDYISSAAPGLSIKFRQLGDSVKSFGEGEILRGIANAASALIGIPSSRVFELFDQFAEASTRDYNAMERVLRATDIFNKSWSEKHYQEQVLRGKIEPKTKIEKDEIKKSNIKELNSMMRDLGFRAARQSGAERDKTIDKVKRYVDYAAREYSMTLDQYEDLIKRFNKGYFTGMVPDEFLSFARLSSESKVKAIAKKINSINDAKERNNYIIRLDNANIENDILSESEIEKVRNLLDDK